MIKKTKHQFIFADADAFIALNNPNDSNYKKALKLANTLYVQDLKLVTCSYVLLELGTVLNMRLGLGYGFEVANKVYNSGSIQLLTGDSFLEQGLAIFKKQSSKNISLNGCVYFALCEKLNISTAFSFDKHWVKNGFKLLEP